MQITKEIVEYAADLSRIKLSEAETEKLKEELSGILDYMEILNQLDTENIEPLSHIFNINNVMRSDIVKESYPVKVLLANAPDNKNEFAVPKTIE